MTLSKREDTENWKMQYKLALCGELALEEDNRLVVRHATDWTNVCIWVTLSKNIDCSALYVKTALYNLISAKYTANSIHYTYVLL
jgi:hypothetical protein